MFFMEYIKECVCVCHNIHDNQITIEEVPEEEIETTVLSYSNYSFLGGSSILKPSGD